jgi:hypothetical protein
MNHTTIVFERFWHKLNYFSFFRFFEILFVTCVKKLLNKKFTNFQLLS